MQIKCKPLLEENVFKKGYKRTIFDNVYYLKLKSPLFVQYEISSGCNQKCIFCYNVWKEEKDCGKKSQLSKEKQFRVLDKIIENEVFEILFSGGEPLTVPWLDKMIKKASDKNIDTCIITNGILLTKSKALQLKKAGLNSIQISLHHFNPQINNKLTQMPGSFKKTVEGIKNAITLFGKGNINVNMVALPETYKDVYDMAKFLHKLGNPHFSVGTPVARGEMHNNIKLVINKKMFLSIYNQLIKAEKDFGINVGFSGGFPICILPELNNKTILMIGNYCDAGLNQLVIDPEGNIKPCVCLNEKLGNILKDNIKEIWNKNKFLIDIRNLKFVPNKCKDCKYISICKGGCRASAKGFYGQINAPDPLEK